MLVEFEYRGDICVVQLKGRFATGQDALYLQSKADELKASGCSKILVDFSHVDYIDSTGIGFLVGIYSSITKNPGGRFALANVNRRVLEVLELTRIAQIIPIYPDTASALAALDDRRKASATRAG